MTTWNAAEYLKTKNTRALLALRDGCYKLTGGRYIDLSECGKMIVTMQQIKAELATRPHIPTKAEGKAMRRIMSRTHLSRKAVLAEPKFRQEIAQATRRAANDTKTFTPYYQSAA